MISCADGKMSVLTLKCLIQGYAKSKIAEGGG
jgi:hypothetical protein